MKLFFLSVIYLLIPTYSKWIEVIDPNTGYLMHVNIGSPITIPQNIPNPPPTELILETTSNHEDTQEIQPSPLSPLDTVYLTPTTANNTINNIKTPWSPKTPNVLLSSSSSATFNHSTSSNTSSRKSKSKSSKKRKASRLLPADPLPQPSPDQPAITVHGK